MKRFYNPLTLKTVLDDEAESFDIEIEGGLSGNEIRKWVMKKYMGYRRFTKDPNFRGARQERKIELSHYHWRLLKSLCKKMKEKVTPGDVVAAILEIYKEDTDNTGWLMSLEARILQRDEKRRIKQREADRASLASGRKPREPGVSNGSGIDAESQEALLERLAAMCERDLEED